ncbi:uncharacterized protein LOC132549052 [Ylistrum balloti]|uniref:uncharacterized protein LOC132549052 n=1 Tax=Ylistrum balloti TaxID=509963 RepID=UPI002905D1BC|nr:uncharacterized protein LOC132549052 [Ylistrum balloti]
MKTYPFRIFTLVFILFSLITNHKLSALHLKGTWNTGSFYKYLAKFAIQKTNTKDLLDTEGFIYGNITSRSNASTFATLVVVDSEYFMEYHGNSTRKLHKYTCARMFDKIDTIAFDFECKKHGLEDFLRKVPCIKGKLCYDEDNPANVIPGYQFTYKVEDFRSPRFWYVSLVACQRNNCVWERNNDKPFDLDYDIWLVNGNPASKHFNPFEHQFSFDDHDIFEIYLVFLIFYIVILPIWIYAFIKQKHPITQLFTSVIALEVTGIALNLLHLLIFSFNGVGFFPLEIVGNAVDTISQCIFMLFLLLVARGWTITHMDIKGRAVVFSVWGVYALSNFVLYFWNLTEVDEISNIDEWQTWPGYITLGLRVVIMIWFVVELRRTVFHSKHPDRLNFLQQFGAFFLVWFIYLPVLAIIGTQISALWKHKTILTITLGSDLLCVLVMIHLLWPSRSILYLIKTESTISTYDLEITGLLDIDDQEETSIFSRETHFPDKQIEPNHNTIQNGKYLPKNGRTLPNGNNHLVEDSQDLIEMDTIDLQQHDVEL